MTDLCTLDKYEIAELAAYSTEKEVAKSKSPWKIYWVRPEEGTDAYKSYKSKEVNQFGAFKFEETCLDFKPDVVCSMRDVWMDQFIYYSPFRDHYSWITMPPIDSYPIKDEFLEIYRNANGFLTYNEWAKKTIEEYSNTRIKVDGVGKYALEKVYSPVNDRATLRKEWGIGHDVTVFGTVMRNQVRKQIPDLLRAFSSFLAQTKNPDKYILHIHTSYPDKQGWDLPSLLTEFQFMGNVYFSYICKVCKSTFAAPFSDARAKCQKCQQPAAVLPNVQLGYTKEKLAELYNVMDLYVQASNCEGFGFPILEAASCGTPIACVDHSGMKQLNEDLDGYIIKIAKNVRVIEGNVDRAYLDNDSLAKILLKFAALSPEKRAKQRIKTAMLARKKYEWSEVVKTWDRIIDGVATPKRLWSAPAIRFNLEPRIPDGLSNREYMDFLYDNILMEPEKKYTSFGAETVRDLNYGVEISDSNGKVEGPMDREKILKVFLEMAKYKQIMEIMRVRANDKNIRENI